MTNTEIIDCTTCKYGYEDERLGIPMCHHPKRFSEDCADFNMHEEKETEESEKPINPADAMKELEEKIALVKQRGTWDGVDVDKYMDEVRGREPEKPVPNDLEEAAWDCVLDSVDVNNPVLLPKYKELLTYLFIAGAKWQKEQMMKEAVEGNVIQDLKGMKRVKSFGKIPEGLHFGDTVRIIIVKED